MVGRASTGFSQEVKGLRDLEVFRVNAVRLKKPVGKVEISYSGELESYGEVFPYLKNSINRDYSLLRTDSLFYPIPAEPSFEDLVEYVVSSNFDTEITAEGVLEDLTIAFGGEIKGNKLRIEGMNRLDIAVAPFKVIEERPIRLFVLSEEGTERTIELLEKAYDFYSSLFGRKSTPTPSSRRPKTTADRLGRATPSSPEAP